MYWFDNAYEAVARFMDMGGNVLWLIAILLFFMWMLIFERIWFFKLNWKHEVARVVLDVVLPDMEKRLEAFVRTGHAVKCAS